MRRLLTFGSCCKPNSQLSCGLRVYFSFFFYFIFYGRKVREQEELLNIYHVCIHILGITPHLTIIITLQLKYCCVYLEDKEVYMEILVVYDEPST